MSCASVSLPKAARCCDSTINTTSHLLSVLDAMSGQIPFCSAIGHHAAPHWLPVDSYSLLPLARYDLVRFQLAGECPNGHRDQAAARTCTPWLASSASIIR